MTTRKVALAIVTTLVILAGLSFEARAGAPGQGIPGCLQSSPIGNPISGSVALEAMNLSSDLLNADIDITLSLQRSGNQFFFRAFFPKGSIAFGNPVNIACDALTTLASDGTILENRILAAFGFPLGTYRIIVAPNSISDTDGALPIPGTCVNPSDASTCRWGAVANITLYATKK